MQKLSDFNVAALTQKVEHLNSQNKLKIDNSFGIHNSRTVIPSGGTSKRKHVHTKVDRKRFAHSLMTRSVGENLCLPAASVLGRCGLTHDATKNGTHGME